MAHRIELVRDADLLPAAIEFSRLRPHVDARRVRSRDRRSSTSVTASTSTTSLRRDAAGRVRRAGRRRAITTYRLRRGRPARVDDRSPMAPRRWEYDDLGRLVAERTADGERRFALRRRPSARRARPTPTGRRRSTTTPVAGGCGRAAPSTSTYVWGDSHLEAIVVDGVVHRFDIDDDGCAAAGRRHHDRLGHRRRHRRVRRRSTASRSSPSTAGTFATVDADSTVSLATVRARRRVG